MIITRWKYFKENSVILYIIQRIEYSNYLKLPKNASFKRNFKFWKFI